MKKTIIAGLIILITVNLKAQTCNDLLKFEGIAALFERKIQSVYDSTKEEFIDEKKTITRTLFLIKDQDIELDNKKYKILETENESEYNKDYKMLFFYTKFYCLDPNEEEYVIEITKSENIIYSATIYTWETKNKVIKTQYKH